MNCPACGYPIDGPPLGLAHEDERRVLFARLMEMESEAQELVALHRYCALDAALDKARVRTRELDSEHTYEGWELWHTEAITE